MLEVLPFTVLDKSVTDCAEAKDAFAIAVLALVVIAVDKEPTVPSTSPLALKLNTASSLSRSLATAPAASLAAVVILVDKASDTPVILGPVKANCDCNSVIFDASALKASELAVIAVFAVANALILVRILPSVDSVHTLGVPATKMYTLLLSFVSYHIDPTAFVTTGGSS